jgi:hypothetical protein
MTTSWTIDYLYEFNIGDNGTLAGCLMQDIANRISHLWRMSSTTQRNIKASSRKHSERRWGGLFITGTISLGPDELKIMRGPFIVGCGEGVERD